MNIVTVCYLSILASVVEPFRFICTDDNRASCTVANLNLMNEGTFVMQHIPSVVSRLTFEELQAPTVDHHLLGKIPPAVKEIQITDSKSIRNVMVPKYWTANALSISGTRLEAIHFDENDELERLYIQGSALKQIPPSIEHLNSLMFTSITHSLMQEVDIGALCRLSKLIGIDLSRNQIEVVTSREDVTNNTSLVEINLSWNKLKQLDLHVFEPFHNLEIIGLTSNILESVTGRFTNSAIVSFNIEQNCLTTLDLCQWSPMVRVHTFNVGWNKLTQVPKCLEKLPNVTYIDLETNQLTSVRMDAFQPLMHLRYLRLTGNRITSFTPNSSYMPPSLIEIDLRKNRLGSLNLTRALPPSVTILT